MPAFFSSLSFNASISQFLWLFCHTFVLFVIYSEATLIFRRESPRYSGELSEHYGITQNRSLKGSYIAEKWPSFLTNNGYNSHKGQNVCGREVRARIHRLLDRPLLKPTPGVKSKIPKGVALDYENLLRSHSPEVINYNTRLTGMPGVNIREIDDVYGGIYDSRVLIKQLRYFLERDDFHSITRLLKDNKGVLNKEICHAFMSDLDHLLFERLKYEYPTKNNMDRMVPFLSARYIIQHVMQQDLESRKYYLWLKPGEIPPKVPAYTPDYVEPESTPENPIHVKDIAAYRSLVGHFYNLGPEARLRQLRELYYRLIEAKKRKLHSGLWKYQRLKPFRKLAYRRKVRTKLNIDRVCPFLSRPRRCTDEIVKEYTGHFEDAVNKEDLATACRLLKRYTRRIDLKNNLPLLIKFKGLFAQVHRCRKYNLEALKSLRGLYWSTVKRHKVLIKYNEPIIVKNAGRTMKDLYEEQLENYRKRRDAEREEKMRKRGINMDEVRDFSNAYGYDWLPILYPEEYEKALEKYRGRIDKLRKKVEKNRLQREEKRRKLMMLDEEEEYFLGIKPLKPITEEKPENQTPAE
ncbi:hypothetical protein BEWA_032650 [Theileria equi strain WA]|uniref:Uncharacterized protein n=1 Tax=Theileria equi strain WA TaxID=1537102 RepID=L0AXX1_THEEQ|nr:hypothetical protein BEWA_032650 [Theileria equi strain WA]AFZ80412.1 hypothetical protein BEWA_032650 [Theileria equi strain WA]|eukprot:XP_004830078.1 hypothetical protein BEWA_032650 [Theileria equi strain WA]